MEVRRARPVLPSPAPRACLAHQLFPIPVHTQPPSKEKLGFNPPRPKARLSRGVNNKPLGSATMHQRRTAARAGHLRQVEGGSGRGRRCQPGSRADNAHLAADLSPPPPRPAGRAMHGAPGACPGTPTPAWRPRPLSLCCTSTEPPGALRDPGVLPGVCGDPAGEPGRVHAGTAASSPRTGGERGL